MSISQYITILIFAVGSFAQATANSSCSVNKVSAVSKEVRAIETFQGSGITPLSVTLNTQSYYCSGGQPSCYCQIRYRGPFSLDSYISQNTAFNLLSGPNPNDINNTNFEFKSIDKKWNLSVLCDTRSSGKYKVTREMITNALSRSGVDLRCQ